MQLRLLLITLATLFLTACDHDTCNTVGGGNAHAVPDSVSTVVLLSIVMGIFLFAEMITRDK